MSQDILKIAHRGASGYALENSPQAFQKAIDLKVDYIEADIQLTSDNVPIVLHDKLLDRTSNAEGYVWDYSWHDIQTNVLLNNGEKIWSLEQLTAFVKDNNSKLYVDLKSFEAEDLVIDILHTQLSVDEFIIGSFHYPTLKNIKYRDDKITTVMIIEGNPIDIERILENTACDIVAFGFDSIDPSSVERVHQLGKTVFSWTINDEREIERAKSIGIDGITSNYPDRI